MRCPKGPRIATLAVAEQRAAASRGRRRLRAYRCELCRDFHLTATAPTRAGKA